MPNPVPTPYGIVFSGGGALGAWEVGCYKAILEYKKGQLPSVVTGASAGAINAAGVCVGMDPDTLQAKWAGLAPENIYTMAFGRFALLKLAARALFSSDRPAIIGNFLSSYRSAFDTAVLRATLTSVLEGYDDAFIDSRIKLAISLTHLANKSRQIFYHLPPGTALPFGAAAHATVWQKIEGMTMLVQALMGSTALPLLFPPFEQYFDGGVLLNQPISPALLLDVEEIYVVIPSAETIGETGSLLSIGATLLETWLSASLVAQIDMVRLRNEIRKYTGTPPLRVCLIRASADLTATYKVSLLDFGKGVDALVADGYARATTRLKNFDLGNPISWY